MRASGPHRRILVGCEGKSEEGYAAFLARLSRDLGQGVYIQPRHLRGGDSLARLEWFEDFIEKEEARTFPFDHRFALLDTDRDPRTPQRAAQAYALAVRIGVRVIRQVPVHEAVLLRHFEGRTRHQPPDAATAMSALQREWPQYEKGLPGNDYARHLSRDHLVRVSDVEPELRELLVAAGLV
ncbi:hypothetical protein PQU92_13955 [Asticcacaulis sp. BYS171W]|uniref:RloB-like protein n=1 Tax=Asticcacaulis aquaticus TaxID=2984212 RepID=A0ABT5HWD3_9CAUL|nr:hypothetical protein [Asticcacaulis aquaticus]MDC7684386.1 hypothetical protein [Asticcacaulis aquaticus]